MIASMNLEMLTAERVPAESRPLLDAIAADVGFVPNLAAVAASSPTLLAAFDALRRAVSDQNFPPIHREIAGVAVGVAVDNAYGVAFHSTMLGSLGVAEADIDAMRAGSEPTNPVHAAVYTFARHVTLDRGKVSDEVVQRAHDAGLTDAACCNSSPSVRSPALSAPSTTWPDASPSTGSCSLRHGTGTEIE